MCFHFHMQVPHTSSAHSFADVNEMTSTERMDADKSLRLAMKKAGRAAAVMVALGKELLSPESGEYLKVIVQKVEQLSKGTGWCCHTVGFCWQPSR